MRLHGDGPWVRALSLSALVLVAFTVQGVSAAVIGNDSNATASNPLSDDVAKSLQLLKSQDVLERRQGARNLLSLPRVPEPAFPSILESATDSDNEVSETSVSILEKSGLTHIPKVLQLAQDPKAASRVRAVELLGRIRRVAIKNQHSDVAKWLETSLLTLLDDPNDSVFDQVIRSLTFQEPRALGVQPHLVAIVKAGKESSRFVSALMGLEQLGEEAKEVIPFLLQIQAAEKDDRHLRSGLARMLGTIGRNDARVAERLSTLLRDAREDPYVRERAAFALATMAVPDPDRLSYYVEALKETSDRKKQYSRLRWAIISAMSAFRIGLDEAKFMLAIAKDITEAGATREEALKTIRKCTEPTEELVTELLLFVQRGDVLLQRQAVATLSATAPRGGEPVRRRIIAAWNAVKDSPYSLDKSVKDQLEKMARALER